jgi:acyl dehydratase
VIGPFRIARKKSDIALLTTRDPGLDFGANESEADCLQRNAVTAMQTATPTLPDLAGWSLGTQRVSYDERDAILYALAVGATAEELELIYEDRLHVLPTFALPLSLWAVESAGQLGAYDPFVTLHVGQELTMRDPLPVSAEIETAARVENVWDKGSAAVIEVTVSSEFFEAAFAMFIPGAGGFEGERGASPDTSPPSRSPDVRTGVRSSPNQAALYRLTGDSHPLHVDPSVAAALGFERPILHGLCTLGSTTRALAVALGQAPWALTQLSARFAGPVYPGDTLDVSCWKERDEISFEVSVKDVAVVKAGRAVFGEG